MTPDRADLAELFARPAWHEHARCRGMGPDRFFAPKSRTAAAKRVCARCPVAVECAAAGMSEAGVWGGLDDADRAQLRRTLRAAAG